jgi:hypothetical protein
MAAYTTNEKDPRVTSTGSLENHTTNNFDSTDNPAQIELTFQFQTEKQVPKVRRHSRKSTSTEAQHERVDRAFDYDGKQITTLDFRKMGVIHPSGRIKEMNEKLGYFIHTVALRTVVDEYGFAHPRIAFYAMLSRPKNGGQHHV